MATLTEEQRDQLEALDAVQSSWFDSYFYDYGWSFDAAYDAASNITWQPTPKPDDPPSYPPGDDASGTSDDLTTFDPTIGDLLDPMLEPQPTGDEPPVGTTWPDEEPASSSPAGDSSGLAEQLLGTVDVELVLRPESVAQLRLLPLSKSIDLPPSKVLTAMNLIPTRRRLI